MTETLTAQTYHELLRLFVETKCEGRQYDSCHNSPCPWASHHGCQHPEHPRFRVLPRTQARAS